MTDDRIDFSQITGRARGAAIARAAKARSQRIARVARYVSGLHHELEAAHPDDLPDFLTMIRTLLKHEEDQ